MEWLKRTNYISLLVPRSTIVALPHPHLTPKSHTRRDLAIKTRANMMASKWMHLLERLDQWIWVLIDRRFRVDDLALGAVYLYA